MGYLPTLILALAIFLFATTCAFAQKDIKDMTDEEFNAAVALQKEMNAKGNLGGIRLFGKGAWWLNKYVEYGFSDTFKEGVERLEKNGTALGPKAYSKMQEWKGRAPDMELLKDVNEYWNHSITFILDRDYAQTNVVFYNECIGPWELERRGKGDCEDYTFAKYFMLKELGFDPHNMRMLTSFSDEHSNHATLLVLLGGELYILDNETDEIVTANNFPLQRGPHTQNEFGYWAHSTDTEKYERIRFNIYYYKKRK